MAIDDDGLVAKLRKRATKVWWMVLAATAVTSALLLLARHPLLG